MKNQNAPRPWVLASLLLTPVLPLAAGEDPALRVKLEEPPADNYRFGISYRAGFNITAQFKSVSRAGAGGRGPGPARGGVDHFYDDGYNRQDSTHSGGGITWFWGYENANQVPGNDTIVYHHTSAIKSGSVDSDPQHGFELTFNRELGRDEKRDWRWGLEGAFGWTAIDISDKGPQTRIITDVYDLGIDPPPPPYNGTFEGPGPLIDDSPTRSVAALPGSREFEADLFTFRFGPYLDIPFDDRWSISLSGGFAVGVADGVFCVNQIVNVGGNNTRQIESGSETDVLYGGYVSATVRYNIDEHWSVFAGGQYLGLTGYEAKAGRQKIELDLAQTVFATFGLSYTF